MICSVFRFLRASLPALFLFAAGQTHAETAEEVVRSVETHYASLTDLTARVTQKNVLASVGKTQTFDAMLRIKRPGKLRLDYTNGQVALVNGAAASFYSRKSAQLIKRRFTDFQQMNLPVAFLLGAARIRDDFDVLQADASAPRTLELLPRKPGTVMKKLVLAAEASGSIRELVIHDRTGNTTVVTFSDVREDGGIDDKAFRFDVPKGTEVIEPE